VVTIQIGGNDIGFSSIAEDCMSASPEATPCQEKYVHDAATRSASASGRPPRSWLT
jgi:hypothetical protein